MEKVMKWLPVAVTLSVGLVLAVLCARSLHSHYERTRVRPEQVWVYTEFRGNPWAERIYTNYVLEVRDGWVRYKTTRTRGGREYEASSTIARFRLGATRIEDSK